VALSDAARLDRPPAAYHLGFVLGPRINAGGRVGQADLGARLLATRDAGEARDIAGRLEQLNEERRGIEAAARYDVSDRLGVSLAYTWLDATEPVPVATGGTRSAIEVRRPEHELSLGVDYTLPNDRTRLRLDVQRVAGLYDSDFKTASFLSGNPDDDFDRVRLSDYTLVNLGFSHDITDKVQLTGRISNLLNESYEELEGYATPGRTMYLGLSARF